MADQSITTSSHITDTTILQEKPSVKETDKKEIEAKKLEKAKKDAENKLNQAFSEGKPVSKDIFSTVLVSVGSLELEENKTSFKEYIGGLWAKFSGKAQKQTGEQFVKSATATSSQTGQVQKPLTKATLATQKQESTTPKAEATNIASTDRQIIIDGKKVEVPSDINPKNLNALFAQMGLPEINKPENKPADINASEATAAGVAENNKNNIEGAKMLDEAKKIEAQIKNEKDPAKRQALETQHAELVAKFPRNASTTINIDTKRLSDAYKKLQRESGAKKGSGGEWEAKKPVELNDPTLIKIKDKVGGAGGTTN